MVAVRRARRHSLCSSPGSPPAAQTTTSRLLARALHALRAPGCRSARVRWAARCSGPPSVPIRPWPSRGSSLQVCGAFQSPSFTSSAASATRRRRRRKARCACPRRMAATLTLIEPPVVILEQRPGAGGEVLEARADADDHVRFRRERVGRGGAGDADRAEVQRMVPRLEDLPAWVSPTGMLRSAEGLQRRRSASA